MLLFLAVAAFITAVVDGVRNITVESSESFR